MIAVSFKQPGWHWRNCRRLSVNIDIRVWPFLSAGADRTDDYTGGEMWIWFGPVAIGLRYDHGDCSYTGPNRLGALSEIEAYERACRFEGIRQETQP